MASRGREKQIETENREVEGGHDHVERGGREEGRVKGTEGSRESKRARRGQAAPFIVGQTYIAVARKL